MAGLYDKNCGLAGGCLLSEQTLSNVYPNTGSNNDNEFDIFLQSGMTRQLTEAAQQRPPVCSAAADQVCSGLTSRRAISLRGWA